ncbi:MAG: acyl-CoA dehydrogenase family protein, partial [Candidatus Spechtbacteria bacterium]|nr:acyl-CoA dehydrogenase family protein [Candidatus Spechtbacteria bacterium]
MRAHEEQIEMLRNVVDEFGKKELLRVGYAELEPKGEFPRELVNKISKMGLMGISFPEEYGGMGMNTVATSIVGERLAFYWPSLQLIWSANVSLAGFPIMTFGNEEQKRRFLPRLASGEILGCYALTEPDAGSDAANIKTRAEKSRYAFGEQEYVLKGTKTFITNANNASVGVVFARMAGE